MTPPAVGSRHRVVLSDLGVGGEAVARPDGFVIFVEDGAPGDEAEVEIVEAHKSYARGRIHRLDVPSPLRVPPPCPIYFECGGCQLQHLSDAAQREQKTRMVRDALRLGHLDAVPVHPCLPTQEWSYRNKMQLVAAAGPPFHLGLYERHSHRVVSMAGCPISHPIAERILRGATEAVRAVGWEAYDEATGTGLLRHVVARVSTARGEALVVLVATREPLPEMERFVARLREAVPEVVGVLVNVNPRRTNVILGPRTRLAWGRDRIVEEAGGVALAIGATSFFQVNTRGLEVVAKTARAYLRLRPRDAVLDAYCGVGALAFLTVRDARRVLGIEEVPEAVALARANAEANGLRHLEFARGKVEDVLPRRARQGERFEAVLLDPPRKGCAPAALEAVVKMGIGRVVYVSCNPATLARDLAVLAQAGYQVHEVQPVDMFPQTSHVECVARLTRRRRAG